MYIWRERMTTVQCAGTLKCIHLEDSRWLVLLRLTFAFIYICQNVIRPAASECMFDDIQSSIRTIRTELSYDNGLYFDSVKARYKRSGTSPSIAVSKYKPIRILPYFHNLHHGLTGEAALILKRVVWNAVHKVSRILSVIRVNGALILARDGCKSHWSSGPNKGKCASLLFDYESTGERCLDNFKIPDAHLAGAYVWSRTETAGPRQVIAPGHGVQHTDYILYITAHSSDTCTYANKQVIAYASYCQLDQNNRPIAGVVNFCPSQIKSGTQKELKSYLTALHEIFHALGFSADLYDKYKDCSSSATGLNCPSLPTSPFILKAGLTRLASPHVDERARLHFACNTESEFGIPMQTKENGKPNSHWHPRFLQGSIMTPDIGLPEVTYVDEFTLAVFEDSGWYQVDFSQADHYIWGKDEGCNFALEGNCGASAQFFCQGSPHGCHYTHRARGRCQKSPYLQPCRVYTAESKDSCIELPIDVRTEAMYSGQVFNSASRCLLANTTKITTNNERRNSSELTGHCFEHRCISLGHLEVRLHQHTNWTYCPLGQITQVDGYNGIIQCPQAGILCTDYDLATTPPSTISSQTSTSTIRQTSSVELRSNTSVTSSSTAPAVSILVIVTLALLKMSYMYDVTQSFQCSRSISLHGGECYR